jgi:hypothetical protein
MERDLAEKQEQTIRERVLSEKLKQTVAKRKRRLGYVL